MFQGVVERACGGVELFSSKGEIGVYDDRGVARVQDGEFVTRGGKW